MKRNTSIIATQVHNDPPMQGTLAIPSDQAQSYDNGLSFNDYLAILKRYKKIILFFTLIGIILGLLVNQILEKQYTAIGIIKIDAEPVKILDYGIDTQEKKSMLNNAVFFQTQYKILRSKKLAKRTIDDLQLESFLENQSRLTPIAKKMVEMADEIIPKSPPIRVEDIFLKNLTIKPLRNSQIVEISYRSSDAIMSAKIVNHFIKNFIDQRTEKHRKSAESAASFLRNELLNARNKLQQSEKELLTYAKQKNIIDTKGDRSILAQSLKNLSEAYIKARQKRITAESIYSKRRRASGDLYASDNRLIMDLKENLAMASAKYNEGLKTYKPSYPAIAALQAKISELQGRIAQETSRAKRSIENDLHAAFTAAQQQEKKLNAEILSYEKKLLQFEDASLQYVHLQRETETNRIHYEGLLQRLKEVTVARSTSNASVDIIDKAYPPYRSSSKNTAFNSLFGAIAGFFLGIVLAFIKGVLNNKIKSLEDLHNLHLPYPILSVLPKVKPSKRKHLALLAANEPDSSMAESIRYLYTNLAIDEIGETPHSLLITSSLAGEGKSVTVLNLASMLASNNKRTLVIDADLRKPTIHKHLGIDERYGLSNYLSEEDADVARPIIKVNNDYPLFVIPAGGMVSDPVNLLAGQKMIDLLATQRDQFDHIIIDSPPVLGMADALVLSNRVEATIFVIANNKATHNDIRSALNNLEKGFTHIAGLVLSLDKSNKINQYYRSNYSDKRDKVPVTFQPFRS